MENITIEELQQYLYMKYVETNRITKKYDEDTMHTSLFMKLVEEVGEVAEALNKIDQRKEDDGRSSLAYELADVIHYAVAIASVCEIDLQEAIMNKDIEASIKYNQQPNLNEYLIKKKTK